MVKKKSFVFVVLVFVIFVNLLSNLLALCGIGYSESRHYIRPGDSTSWSVGVTKNDYNGDGYYASWMDFENVPYIELNWTSYYPNNYTPVLDINNTNYQQSIVAYALNNTLSLPFGNNDFQIVHHCESGSSGLSAAAPAYTTIIPFFIENLNVKFSQNNLSNVNLTWDEFNETELYTLTVLRKENDNINLSNYLLCPELAYFEG